MVKSQLKLVEIIQKESIESEKKEQIKPVQILTPPHDWVSKQALAKGLGVTIRTVDRMNIVPVGYIGKRAFYLLNDVFESKFKKQNESLKKKYKNADLLAQKKIPLIEERTRSIRAQADKWEIKVKNMKSELITKDYVLEASQQTIDKIYIALENFPRHLKIHNPNFSDMHINQIKMEIEFYLKDFLKRENEFREIINNYDLLKK